MYVCCNIYVNKNYCCKTMYFSYTVYIINVSNICFTSLVHQ